MLLNSLEEYTVLKKRMDTEHHICTPIYRDTYYHPAANTLLCVGVTFMDGTTNIVSNTHRDSTRFEFPVGLAKCYVGDSKSYPVITDKIVDVGALAYIAKHTPPSIQDFYTPYIHDTYRLFKLCKDANKLIPLAVWSDVLKKYNSEILKVLVSDYLRENTPEYQFQISALTALRSIEYAGIAVDTHLVEAHFGENACRYVRDGMLYTQYNTQTITGRPSNKFGDINFAALNKKDGSRSCFVSRYVDGVLVQLDFDAYHLRLIAEKVGCSLPDGAAVHKELAKIYFSTDDITPDLYARGKQITFEIMYGMTDETYGVELFAAVKTLREKMFLEYKKTDRVTLPTGLAVPVEGANPSKILNYYMQSLELVTMLPKIEKILNVIKGNKSHLVLYTYDSILLDMETTEKLSEIVDILEESGLFPVHVSTGKNYHNIEEVEHS